MKNSFGNSIIITLFGESHGAQIGVVADGLAPGLAVDETEIAARLALRRPWGEISTARREPDVFCIVSGVYNGKTTGTPLCILIPNQEADSSAYEKTADIARPGHADYTGYCKYEGYNDPRGGGHFSGRLTAPLVAVGAIVQAALEKKGIEIATHIARCAGIADRPFADFIADRLALQNRPFGVLDETAGKNMQEAIMRAKAEGDSVGGVLETWICGVPAGVGEPWFGSLESTLSAALFGIPAVKGVAFGDGFAMAERRGSEVNGSIRMNGSTVCFENDANGGILGGISNGAPIRFSCAVKPTPTIGKKQQTVQYTEGKNTELEATGRHDPAIVHRARVVVESVSALVLADMLCQRFGTDWLRA